MNEFLKLSQKGIRGLFSTQLNSFFHIKERCVRLEKKSINFETKRFNCDKFLTLKDSCVLDTWPRTPTPVIADSSTNRLSFFKIKKCL